MKNLLRISVPLLFAGLFLTCEKESRICCLPDTGLNEGIAGTWQLYERGYSPGIGYITEEVAAFPAQTITLASDNTFSSSIEALKEYKFYLILGDPHSDKDILSLHKINPGTKLPEIDQLEHSYHIEQEDASMKLYYRYCYEGCHLAFSK